MTFFMVFIDLSSYIVTYAGTTCYHHFRWDFWFFLPSSGGAAGRRGRWGSVRRVAPSFFLSSLCGVLCQRRQGALVEGVGEQLFLAGASLFFCPAGLWPEDRQVALHVFLFGEFVISGLCGSPYSVLLVRFQISPAGGDSLMFNVLFFMGRLYTERLEERLQNVRVIFIPF